MNSAPDTIVAPITGMSPAPVAVVRLCGPDAWAIAEEVFTPWPSVPQTRHATFGRFATGDDGLAMPFDDGHGFTGEQAVEFSLHGSPASVQALLDRCIEHGARPAEPGEFTLRAFANGRLDLTQAEAVRDTVEARTQSQLRLANVLRGGVLRDRLRELGSELDKVLAEVEASVDFSEEIGELNSESAARRLEVVSSDLEHLLSTARTGRLVREGVRVAIVGRPNVGKSSLLNHLVGHSRAMVSDSPGTTRDYLEEHLEMDGVAVTLLDTAGLRFTGDPLEAEGVRRAREVIGTADLVWHLYDASRGWLPEDEELEDVGAEVWRIANKVDLTNDTPGPLAISAITGQGVTALVEALVKWVGARDAVEPLISARHEVPLRQARESIQLCLDALRNSLPDDLLATGLREARRAIGVVTGESADPDAIEALFSTFCIGK